MPARRPPSPPPPPPPPPPAAPAGRPAAAGGWLRWLRPVVSAAAVLYFLIDALVLGVIRPFAARLARWPPFARFGAWVAGLGPYPSLALLAVPLVILEPAKPVGLFLIGTGHPVKGGMMIAVAELVKVTLVERLFRLTRDKLLTIPAFAWGYWRVRRWLDRLAALPAWQAVRRAAVRAREGVRRAARALRARIRAAAKRL